ncbi:CgeB family protein [Dyadobacter sandarakinus]|uniref:Glycosyltransferase n=1 Tax=Dyadobacter sandarakinus TaxID=2747268 RepID=A0ABX7I458_9BACT|nr:glycosyltransferase [Dyadobacter sandarakinus]QRR00297.1 glycosyltransferase [Dyadobacter sandarakinus]
MKFAFFGSSLVSAYWNGAATYYRGIIRAMHESGHQITFYEPDAYDRQKNRDIADPDYARIVVYQPNEADVFRVLEEAMHADVIIKTSGVGVFDELLEKEVAKLGSQDKFVIFWDVDAPATLDRVQHTEGDYFRELIPQYNLVLTYGGGDPVINAYTALGARKCVPIYNALDPETHHPVEKEERFHADLVFLGNRLPDREKRVEQFFLEVAAQMPEQSFILGGNGWHDKPMSANIHYLGHVFTKDHNALNCSPKAVLNISRDSMAKYGFSPATRVFEAAGAGACIITDYWEGIDFFFEPGREILVARSGEEVGELLASLTEEQARAIGQAALQKVLDQHTYAHRVVELERVLSEEPVLSKAAL